MRWQAALAGAILVLWLVLLFTSGAAPSERWRFDALTPFAFAAITYFLTEPVVRDRRERKRRKDGRDDA